jgi:DNA-binding response OmpR family regulator
MNSPGLERGMQHGLVVAGADILRLKVRGGILEVDIPGRTIKSPKLREPARLTPSEMALVVPLVQNHGITLSKRRLARSLDPRAPDYVNDNAITQYMKRTRDKIREGVRDITPTFEAINGFGYRCTEPTKTFAEILQQARDAGPESHLLYRVVQGGDLVLDKSSGEVLIAPHVTNNVPVSLTPLETAFAVYLLNRPDETVSRQDLAGVITEKGNEYIPDVTVNAHMCRLRQKLGEPRGIMDPSFASVHGGGYRSTVQ